MTSTSGPPLPGLLERFDALDATVSEEGDHLFEDFGPGNANEVTDYPFERFEAYRRLLVQLHDHSPDKYLRIHKGTPFFFMAWLAFDFRDHERALTYLDAAISEDARIDPLWPQRVGAQFLRLETSMPIVGQRTVAAIRDHLHREITRFTASTGSQLTCDSFITRFVSALLIDGSLRSIVTAFYVFLLEADERREELRLRSSGGGSTGPTIALLFRGGLLMESILKHFYPGHKTLGDIFKSAAFKADFPGLTIHTSAASLRDIHHGILGDTVESAFTTTTRLRNTTGHNLVWDDVFGKPEVVTALIQQELNAVFYLVDRKF